MAYRLGPRLTACVIEDQAIFLDVARDRYFSLAGEAARTIAALAAGQDVTKDQIAPLARAGLAPLAPAGDEIRGAQLATPTPTASICEQGRARRTLKLSAVAGVGIGLFRTQALLKHAPLSSILDDLAHRRTGRTIQGAVLSLKAAEIYLDVRGLVPIKPCCLPDSLALLDWLLNRGLSADLVFGVKLNPFSAHCWLQSGETVLNDTLDTVRLHTPILIV